MSRFERVGHLNSEIEKLLGFEWASFDAVLESFAFEQLHGDERLAVVLANLVNGANVRMIQAGSSARLAVEAFEGLFIFSHGFGQEFKRHHPAQLCIFGLEDHTHPAAAKLFDDSIVRDFGTRKGTRIRHGRAY